MFDSRSISMAMAIRDRFATTGDLHYVMDEMKEKLQNQDNAVGSLWSKHIDLTSRILVLGDDMKFVKGDVQNMKSDIQNVKIDTQSMKSDIQIIKEQMNTLTTVLLNNKDSLYSNQADPSPEQDCSSSRNIDVSMDDSSGIELRKKGLSKGKTLSLRDCLKIM